MAALCFVQVCEIYIIDFYVYYCQTSSEAYFKLWLCLIESIFTSSTAFASTSKKRFFLFYKYLLTVKINCVSLTIWVNTPHPSPLPHCHLQPYSLLRTLVCTIWRLYNVPCISYVLFNPTRICIFHVFSRVFKYENIIYHVFFVLLGKPFKKYILIRALPKLAGQPPSPPLFWAVAEHFYA